MFAIQNNQMLNLCGDEDQQFNKYMKINNEINILVYIWLISSLSYYFLYIHLPYNSHADHKNISMHKAPSVQHFRIIESIRMSNYSKLMNPRILFLVMSLMILMYYLFAQQLWKICYDRYIIDRVVMGCCVPSQQIIARRRLGPFISPIQPNDQKPQPQNNNTQGKAIKDQPHQQKSNNNANSEQPYKGISTSGQTTYYFNETQMTNLRGDFILKEGQYSIGQYFFNIDESNKQNLLGEGGFGKVFKGKSLTGEHKQVAIKVMIIQNEHKLQIYRQQTLRQQLVKSQGIVKVYMTKIIPIGQKRIYVIALQLMNEGHLKVPQGGFTVDQALQKIRGILRCYRQLFKRGMIHRDLKPQNILVNSKGEMKISDFGAAMEITDKKCQPSPVSRSYASPEQIKNHQYTNKCDVYALGCIFVQFLLGKTPKGVGCAKNFNIVDMSKLKKLLNEKNISDEIINFIEGCLRAKETVQIQKSSGQKIQDPQRSRFGWERVYLHPLFKNQFRPIIKQTIGKQIFLTLKTEAEGNQIDIVKILETYESQSKSNTITKQQFTKLFKNAADGEFNDNINRLDNIFGLEGSFVISEFIQAFQRVDNEQYSNYSSEEAYSFAQMFSPLPSYAEDRGKQLELWMAQLKTGSYTDRKTIELSNDSFISERINFTAFPLIPPMLNLEAIIIRDCPIQVLDVRLKCENLKHLHVIQCMIERVITIRGCPLLQTLSLYKNKIRQIGGLQMIDKLQQLELADNRITKINNIGHLKKLKILILDTNRISVCSGLASCVQLEQLTLRNNRIKQLGQQLLEISNPSCLKSIHLGGFSIIQNKICWLKQQKIWKCSIGSKINTHKHISTWVRGKDLTTKKIYTTEIFKDGKYKIFSFNNNQCIELGNIRAFQRGMRLAQVNNDSEQVWFISHFQDNQYCIFTHDQTHITMHLLDLCIINPYLQGAVQDLDQKDDPYYRWSFEVQEADSNGEIVFRIRNVASKWCITEGMNSTIEIMSYYTIGALKWDGVYEEKYEFWYVRPEKEQK